jgi:hypothetical protein
VLARHSVRRSAHLVWLEAARHALMAVEVRRREAPKVEAESVALRPAAARPEALVLRRQGAEAQPSARFAAEVGRGARRSAGLRILADQAAVPGEEPDVALAVERPQVAPHAAGPRQAGRDAAALEAAAVSGVAAEPLPAVAELDGPAALPAEVARVEAGEEGARRRAEPDVVVARRRAAPGEVAVLLAALAWAFRPDQVLPWLGPRQAARSLRAMQERSTASP